MNYSRKIFNNTYCLAEISSFIPEEGVAEYNVMIHIAPSGSFSEQLTAIHISLKDLLLHSPFNHATVVFKRYFISDIAKQYDILKEQISEFSDCATSIIQQPPLDGSDVALWIYIIIGEDIIKEEANRDHTTHWNNNDFTISHNGYKHVWSSNKQHPSGNVSEQTVKLLRGYNQFLIDNGLSIKDNCIRTWFFIQNIDTNYAAFAEARKTYFVQNGLTNKSHYIASTGIEGCNALVQSLVTMDAYSLQGAENRQIRYLYALSHLSHTYDYGVTFERGVTIKYGDRQQIFISGTASIDNCGSVLHEGNIKEQTFRIWENIDALLNETDATLDDITQIIVYLRNSYDYNSVKNLFNDRFTNVPIVITLAPVCRQMWLIEMECIALNNNGNKIFRYY